MSEPKKPRGNVNPPHIPPVRQDPDAAKVALYRYHQAAGSLGDYYALFPMDRPPEPEPKGHSSRGRSR